MRIYLDSCAFQDLKKEKYSDVLNKIQQPAPGNIYCFSEAHLHDLCRDPSDHKFRDMEFIETIVQDNCLYFEKRTRFKYCTPRKYYDDFDWTPVIKSAEILADPSFAWIRLLFQAIPLDWEALLPADSLPEDFPLSMREAMRGIKNMDDLMQNFLGMTEALSSEQKKFKELLQYLHKHALLSKIYENIGILGFDGEQVTDREKLEQSYTAYFNAAAPNKNAYDLFLDEYVGLELFGLVKGKPKKQKMMNMIDDGRHAFYGAHCDIVISSDEDFLKKTGFLYNLLGIPVVVAHLDQFAQVLHTLEIFSALSFTDMVGEISGDSLEDKIIATEKKDDEQSVCIGLDRLYFSYFDLGVHQFTSRGRYYFFSKRLHRFSIGTLVREIAFVTDRLVETFGNDSNGKGAFDIQEIEDQDWTGRVWRFGDFVVVLNYKIHMNLSCYPVAYLQQAEK